MGVTEIRQCGEAGSSGSVGLKSGKHTRDSSDCLYRETNNL